MGVDFSLLFRPSLRADAAQLIVSRNLAGLPRIANHQRSAVESFIDALSPDEKVDTMVGIDMLRSHGVSLGAYSDEIATDSEANRHSRRAKRQSEKSERSDAGILYIA